MIVVVGGANVDVKARTTAALTGATSNPGTVTRSPGRMLPTRMVKTSGRSSSAMDAR